MLTKCNTCDGPVSDKASKCPHCGASIADDSGVRQCKECSSFVSAEMSACPHCGYTEVSEEDVRPGSLRRAPVCAWLSAAALILSAYIGKGDIFLIVIAVFLLIGALARRERQWRIPLILVSVLLVLAVFKGLTGYWHVVKYQVSGTGTGASLDYTSPNGTEHEHVTLPWSLEISMNTGDVLKITALADGPEDDIIVKIYADGKRLKNGSSISEGQRQAVSSALCCSVQL